MTAKNKTKSFIRGFTMIELLVVMSVMAILSTIVLFGFGKSQASARDTQRLKTMNSIQGALEAYRNDNNKYPIVSTDVGGFTGLESLLFRLKYLVCLQDPSYKDASGNYKYITSDGATCLTGTNINDGWGDLAIGYAGFAGFGTFRAGYVYSSNGTTYTLTLNKESGGSTKFVNPN